jgi:hypothetical protein
MVVGVLMGKARPALSVGEQVKYVRFDNLFLVKCRLFLSVLPAEVKERQLKTNAPNATAKAEWGK